MIWQLLLVAMALGAAYYRWSRRRLYRLAAEIPCLPDSYPVIGHAHIFAGSNEDIMQMLQKIGRESNQHDGLTSFWVINRLFVGMTDPAAIELVSKACLDKDEFLVKFIRTAIGNGSIFAPVNIWRPRRKINAPFFSRKNVDQLLPVFNTKSSIMVDLLRVEAGRGDFPIWRYVTTFTFDSVCETALNTEINTQKFSDHYFFLHAIDECTQLLAKRGFQPWLHPDVIYKRLPMYKRYNNHLQRIYTFLEENIQKKKEKITESGLKNFKNNNKLSHFIDVIIQSSGGLENGYSDMELREELMVFMIAGSDTSATLVSFTAVLLSRYPDVQEKVYQELQEVFEESDRAVTPEDLLKLTYLEAVIKESLRLYPPVPIVVREIHGDVLLPSGTTLVDDTTVMINIWGTHRNPAYWGSDAEEFRPERFLQGPLPHPAMFVPFSHSVRNCIGATYAMTSAKTALTNLIRRFRLLPPAGARAADLQRPLPVKYEIMMKAVDNFTLRIEDRSQNKTLTV
ncbi:cytochrome P450 4C1-like [Cydia pomonella]|uniref:cytochrome P450 4C1-like n=1 Tax=Cydia pomonella TaxID=82600 RepID=UPI002ADE04D8|nr:cytochrome P450 4C1-like [Cydia pomonella]